MIDVDPDYQREVVWTGKSTQFGCSRRMLIAIAERMTGLVDSLMGTMYPMGPCPPSRQEIIGR
jgi:hypothetical protein